MNLDGITADMVEADRKRYAKLLQLRPFMCAGIERKYGLLGLLPIEVDKELSELVKRLS